MAAGRSRSVPAYFRAALEVLWGRGGRCGRPRALGLLTENSQFPVAEAAAGTKRHTPQRAEGRLHSARARSPPPAPPGGRAGSPAPCPGEATARSACSPLLPLRRPMPVPFSQPPPKVWPIARVAALLLFVKQALSLGRVARGMWQIPGKDYINQSIISPEKPSTNQSKS